MQFIQGKKMDNDMLQGHIYFFCDQTLNFGVF